MAGVMVRRVSQLLIGLVFYGYAGALMVRAELGVDPWTVFAQGLENVTSLSLGVLTVLIGAVVLLLWIPLRQRPGLGTVLNILLIGPALDVGLLFIETPPELWQRVAMFAGGLLLLSVATGLYIGSHFGAGPRDGLMTGLTSRFGIPTWIGRTSIEVTVLISGWLLGGDVWIGTLAFAVLIGPMCGVTLPLLAVSKTSAKPIGQVRSSAEQAG
jgi:uncharacterized membrane protein YczE